MMQMNVKSFKLMFISNLRMGKICDLSDFHHGMIVGPDGMV